MGSSGHSQPFNGNSLLSVSQEASAPAWSQVPSDGGDVTGHIGRASYTGQSEIYLQEKRNAWGGGVGRGCWSFRTRSPTYPLIHSL